MTNMKPLTDITFRLPDSDPSFANKLASILAPFSARQNDTLQFAVSDPSFLPRISLQFGSVSEPHVQFRADQRIEIPITNTTAQTRPPKIPFNPLRLMTS